MNKLYHIGITLCYNLVLASCQPAQPQLEISIRATVKDTVSAPNGLATKFKIGALAFEHVTLNPFCIAATNVIPPLDFKKINDSKRVSALASFQIDYYRFDNSSNDLVINDSFCHLALFRAFGYDRDTDFYSNPYYEALMRRHFEITRKKISNYGNCYICKLSTVWSNATDKQAIIMINAQRKELSFWEYDEFEVDSAGNIVVLFRLKDKLSRYYYVYNEIAQCFLPVGAQ